MLIATLFQVRLEVYRESRNEVRPQNLTEVGFRLETFRFWCIMQSHGVTIPESVLETNDHCFARVFSRFYRYFS